MLCLDAAALGARLGRAPHLLNFLPGQSRCRIMIDEGGRVVVSDNNPAVALD